MNMGGSYDVKGTWAQEKVALHLAIQCSPEFYTDVLNWTIDKVGAWTGELIPIDNQTGNRFRVNARDLHGY